MNQMDFASSAVSTLSLAFKPTINQNGRISWPGESAKKQYFSLPDGIVYFMAKNPSSPEVYLKLAKSCKYFFEKLPLLIAKRIIVDENRKRMCLNDVAECGKKKKKCCVNVDFAKITKSKIWLISDLNIHDNNVIPNLASVLLPRLYCCDNARISICWTKMTMKEFELWGTAFQKLYVCNGKNNDIDGNVVTLDSMLEAFNIIRKFTYWFDNSNPAAITSSTIKNILTLKNLVKLEDLCLINISEVVPVEDFKEFVMIYKNTKFTLWFYFFISDEYKVQLNKFIDEIIASKISNCLIWYHGHDEGKFKIMQSRFHL